MQVHLNVPVKGIASFKGFQREFGSDEVCRKRLFQTRWPGGFRCPICNWHEFTLIEPRQLYLCKSCRHQTSLTAGTIFHKSKTPLVKWFWIIYRISAPSKSEVCIAEMQRELKIKDYKTIWFMTNKIRRVITYQDHPYKLVGLFRTDKSHFFADSSFVPLPGVSQKKFYKKSIGELNSSDTSESSTKIETVMMVAVSTKKVNSWGDEEPAFAQAFVVKDTSTDNIEEHLTKLNFEKKDIRLLMNFTKLNGWLRYSVTDPKTKAVHYDTILMDSKYSKKLVPWTHKLIEESKHDAGVPRGGLSDKNFRMHLSDVRDQLNSRFGPIESFHRLLRACATTVQQ